MTRDLLSAGGLAASFCRIPTDLRFLMNTVRELPEQNRLLSMRRAPLPTRATQSPGSFDGGQPIQAWSNYMSTILHNKPQGTPRAYQRVY